MHRRRLLRSPIERAGSASINGSYIGGGDREARAPKRPEMKRNDTCKRRVNRNHFKLQPLIKRVLILIDFYARCVEEEAIADTFLSPRRSPPSISRSSLPKDTFLPMSPRPAQSEIELNEAINAVT